MDKKVKAETGAKEIDHSGPKVESQKCRPKMNQEGVEEEVNSVPSTASETSYPIPETTTSTTQNSYKTRTDKVSNNFDVELNATVDEVTGRKGSEFKPDDLEIFQKPMCLVSSDENNVMKIVENTVEQIEKIKWPIVSVSIVGLCRTGKSYLMNRLAKSSRGFEMGSTMDSVTKGILVWCRIHPQRSNTVLMLLDTEGIGDVNKDEHGNDNTTFILATLLCNCLVYNMNTTLNRDVVSKLTFVTQFAKHIHFKEYSTEDNSSFRLILPEFLLCLRNFDLDMVLNGKTVTEDEYLEHCLTITKGADEHANNPKRCIQTFFSVRKCFTFPTPGDQPKKLETLDFVALPREFNDAIDTFVSYVYSRPPMKLLVSKPLNGQMFATLATRYVKALRDSGVLDVDDAFTAAAGIENNRLMINAVETFESGMKDIGLPVPSKRLQSCYTQLQQEALKYLRDNVVHDIEGKSESKAEVKMNDVWNTLREENTNKIRGMCDAKLQQIYDESIGKQIQNNCYEVEGGYRKFQRDMLRMKRMFVNSLEEFEQHEILLTWLEFIQRMEETENAIIEVDHALTTKAKEDERRQNADLITRTIEEHTKSKLDALHDAQMDFTKHISVLETEREEHFTDLAKLTAEMITLKVGKDLMEKELNRLKAQHEERRNKWFGGRIWNAIFNI